MLRSSRSTTTSEVAAPSRRATDPWYEALAEIADAAVRADSEQGLFDRGCYSLATLAGCRLAVVALAPAGGRPAGGLVRVAVAGAAGATGFLSQWRDRHDGGDGLLELPVELVVDDLGAPAALGPGTGALEGEQRAFQEAGCRSLAVLPLSLAAGEEPLGVLLLAAGEAGGFAGAVRPVANRVAATLAFSLDGFRHRRATEESRVRLATSEQRFRALLEHSADAIAIAGEEGNLLYLSPSMRTGPGGAPARLVDLVHPSDREVLEAGVERAARLGAGERLSVPARSAPESGEERQFDFVLTNHLDDPAVAGVVANVRDVTETRAAEEELRRLALHDSLTGLANRSLLVDRLGRELAQAEGAAQPVALFYVDLDRFAAVNDRLGHDGGDAVLASVASLLRDGARPVDTVARLGADEFVVMAPGLDVEHEVNGVAARLLAAVRSRFAGEGQLTASVGIALGSHGDDPDELVRHAGAAMTRAKKAGGDRIATYDEEYGERLADRARLEEDLRQAVTGTGLLVAYHPIVSLRTGRVKALEALVRWRHPERGLLPPDLFIPLAEDSGLVIPLGECVLAQAAAQVAAWAAAGQVPEGCWVSVNVSALQLQLPDFPDRVARIVAEAGARPDQVLLELTETALSEDLEVAVANAQSLQALGFGLAVDDFGTGYASLSQLKRFPVHTLKVDKGFVDGIGVDEDDTKIVAAVVSLARALGIPSVAEGVETERQARLLAEMGCDALQGYLFTKPLLGEEATAWLTAADRRVEPDGSLTA